MRSVHDNNIYAYCVLAQLGRIVLHTEFLDGAEYTDVVFFGVLAHDFRGVLPGNIVFDVREVDLQELYAAHQDTFEREKPHGWPVQYADGAELVDKLKERGLRGYLVDSSYGLDGWVLAAGVEYIERAARWTPA